jgi:V/A-type H+/Na+-transporting ATPase subunit C
MPQNATSDFAAINSRIRVMYSTLLSKQDYTALSEANGLDGLINQLKNTVYGPYLERAKDKELTARRAAFQIRERLSEVFHSIINMSPDYTRPVLTQFYRYYQINNLKAVLRGIVTNSSWDRVRYVLFPFSPQEVLPLQGMLETGNVTQAVELLKGTTYYETLLFAMKRYSVEQSLFPIEVALDLDFWRELWREVKALPGQDRESATHIIGSLLDMNNLMWAIRYRVYHNLSEEEVINYTLSFGYRVRDEDIRSIAAGADIPSVVKRIYPDLQNVEEVLQNLQSGLPKLELLLQRQVAEKCHSAFLGNPFQIGIPLAFLILFDQEIQDLVVLLEAKSNHIPVEKYKDFLVKEMQ